MYPFIPEGLYPVTGTVPIGTDNAVTCDNISLKDAEMVWIHVHLQQAVGFATVLTPLCGTAVASCVTALPEDVPIWYANTTTANSLLIRQTDAKLFTVDVGVTGAIHVIFQIDPASLGANDCLGLTVADSNQATDIISVVYWIKPAYGHKVADNTATQFLVD